MRRTLLTLAVVMSWLSCAGFHQVERGEWNLVYVDGAQRGPEAPREVISRDDYEGEVSAGTRRGYEPPQGFEWPQLHETDAIGMTVGEVQGFRVAEATQADLYVDGNAVEVYWGPVQKHDRWQGDTDVTVSESTLFVKAKKAGTAALRLVRGNATKDVPVTVK